MLRAVAPLIAAFGMLAIVGCGGRDPVAKEANDTAGLPTINDAVPDATGAAPDGARSSAGSVPAAASARIPPALHGRWGLTPMDCTSTRGDAKALLIVGPSDVKFYESRAIPGPDTQTGPDSINGNFAFTGEGQTWTKFQALELRGQELVRTESNPVASFTYARCK
jgi:hypothetical protein